MGLGETVGIACPPAAERQAQLLVQPPKPLGSKGLKCHSLTHSVVPGRALVHRAKLSSALIGLHLLQERHACAAGREIPLDLSFPVGLIAVREPRRKLRLLFRR